MGRSGQGPRLLPAPKLAPPGLGVLSPAKPAGPDHVMGSQSPWYPGAHLRPVLGYNVPYPSPRGSQNPRVTKHALDNLISPEAPRTASGCSHPRCGGTTLVAPPWWQGSRPRPRGPHPTHRQWMKLGVGLWGSLPTSSLSAFSPAARSHSSVRSAANTRHCCAAHSSSTKSSAGHTAQPTGGVGPPEATPPLDK